MDTTKNRSEAVPVPLDVNYREQHKQFRFWVDKRGENGIKIILDPIISGLK